MYTASTMPKPPLYSTLLLLPILLVLISTTCILAADEPCTAPPCQGKQTWPELLGKDQDTAYDTIKRENPQVTNIVYLISNSIGREENDEFCCNRVVLVIGALPTGGEGISKVPQVG
ncbi:hypothetical protein DAI22_05g114100 [Oryza sativa Japonica Group]|nr:hypothetical protein DAI22_05g114100 [Oryza sativa Japonica Group]